MCVCSIVAFRRSRLMRKVYILVRRTPCSRGQTACSLCEVSYVVDMNSSSREGSTLHY